MPTTSFEFIFHGTGCSAGVPSIACLTRKPATCETCTSAVTPEGWKNKRKNTGGIVRVRNDNGEERVLVIDVGKTFMAAAVDIFPRHDMSRIDAVLLTHGHADAINGLDDLRSWTLGEKRIQDYIDICASEDTFNDIKRGFPYLVYQGHGSGSGHVPQFKWHIIEPNKPFYLNGIDFPITAVNVHHGYLPMFQRLDPAAPDPYMCFGFILGDIMVYMSDVSHIPEEAWTRIEAAGNGYKFFVVDCLRPTKLAAHFGLKDTVDAANRIKAHRTYLFGFGHEISHDGWGTITRVIEGKDPGRVSPLVQQALDALVELGVKGRDGLRICPAYDGQHLKLIDGHIFDEDS